MKKKKNVNPVFDDKVRLRGRIQEGYLRRLENVNWAIVDWTSEEKGPIIVHLYELEKIDD